MNCPRGVPRPCGLIIALESNTKFSIYGKKHSEEEAELEEKDIISLNQGDALLFDGITINSGSSYTNENYRIHIYIDSNNPMYQRIKGESYVISSGAGAGAGAGVGVGVGNKSESNLSLLEYEMERNVQLALRCPSFFRICSFGFSF